jgi:hypothetical protein
MSSTLRRVLVGAAALASIAGPVALASPADARTCAEVDIYRAGVKTPIGSCTDDGDAENICTADGLAPLGYGAGVYVCAAVPIAAALG